MGDLGTILSIEDCLDLLEISQVDTHNRKIIDAAAAKRR